MQFNHCNLCLIISQEIFYKLKLEMIDFMLIDLQVNIENRTILGYKYFVVSEKLNENGFKILVDFNI